MTAASSSSSSPSTSTTTSSAMMMVGLFSVAAILRIAVGYQPHSGQDGYHGSDIAYGGDFEAQRHWMELTWHLPVGDWYWYDLQYWGLDYPPLTAYVSFVCAAASHFLVGPASVALDLSRGFEDSVHKAFMRGTVLILDLSLWGTAIWAWTARLVTIRADVAAAALDHHHHHSDEVDASLITTKQEHPSSAARLRQQEQEQMVVDHAIGFLIVMLQPAIVLIDHGHFQYNTVALGLVFWATYFLIAVQKNTRSILVTRRRHAVLGSILFCLALSFKQTTLYYALIIFSYLLGWCCVADQSDDCVGAIHATPFTGFIHSVSTRTFVSRFILLGMTVVMTFLILWWPFIVYGPSDWNTTTKQQRLLHILNRIFPLHRGLYENKVANLWCALSVWPLRLPQRFLLHAATQRLVAMLITLLMQLPACAAAFLIGCHRTAVASLTATTTTTITAASTNQDPTREKVTHADPAVERINLQTSLVRIELFLWCQSACALSFFLASVQVHEKSLLLALAPMSLLWWRDPALVKWFSLVTAWTLWPLMVLDRLQVAYFCCIIIYLAFEQLVVMDDGLGVSQAYIGRSRTASQKRHQPSFFTQNTLLSWFHQASYMIMILLHLAELLIQPPSHLPDLFPVLWSVVGCACIVTAWMACLWHIHCCCCSSMVLVVVVASPMPQINAVTAIKQKQL